MLLHPLRAAHPSVTTLLAFIGLLSISSAARRNSCSTRCYDSTSLECAAPCVVRSCAVLGTWSRPGRSSVTLRIMSMTGVSDRILRRKKLGLRCSPTAGGKAGIEKKDAPATQAPEQSPCPACCVHTRVLAEHSCDMRLCHITTCRRSNYFACMPRSGSAPSTDSPLAYAPVSPAPPGREEAQTSAPGSGSGPARPQRGS